MHRTVSSIKRHTLTASLAMLLAVLAGCGANPVAPTVSPSSEAMVGKADKHPNHANGRERNSPNYTSSTGVVSGTSGSMSDPGASEGIGEFVIE